MNYLNTNKLDINSFVSHRGLYIILVSTALVFFNTLYNGFVWDDWILMVPNKVYRTFDIGQMFLSKANSLEYLPFRDLTLAIDYKIWGMNPFGYHLSNLIFYLLSLIALYKMIERLVILTGEKQGNSIPFWTTLIFALHPLHVEVVNFIAARNNILAGLFLFLSFNLCLAGIQRKNDILILLSAVPFIISLFSKANAVFYPLFLAVVLFFTPNIGISLRKRFLIFLLFSLMGLFAVWIHISNASSTSVISENLPRYGVHNLTVIMSRALQIPFFYLKKLILPYPLGIKYLEPFTTGGSLLFPVLSLVYMIIVFFMVWVWRKGNLLVLLSVAWYFFSLGPVLNIFPTSPVVADRYAYFAVLSLGLLTAYLIKRTTVGRKVVICAVIGVVLIWGYIDFFRNRIWASDITLWESELSINPDVKAEYAIALWNKGRYEEALGYLKKESEDKGSYEYSLYKGKYLFHLGKYDDAVKHYKKALAEGAGAIKETHLFIAQAYEKTGSDMLAMKHYLRVFDTKSQDPLGVYEGETREGIERIRDRLAPELNKLRLEASNEPSDLQAQLKLATFLYDIGMYEESQEYYLNSLRLNPSNWDIWYNSALVYMRLYENEKAIKSFKRVLELKPGDANALRNIGMVYMTMKEYAQAAGYFKTIFERAPDDLYAAFTLGKIYFLSGDKEESKKYFLKTKALSKGNDVFLKSTNIFLEEVK